MVCSIWSYIIHVYTHYMYIHVALSLSLSIHVYIHTCTCTYTTHCALITVYRWIYNYMCMEVKAKPHYSSWYVCVYIYIYTYIQFSWKTPDYCSCVWVSWEATSSSPPLCLPRLDFPWGSWSRLSLPWERGEGGSVARLSWWLPCLSCKRRPETVSSGNSRYGCYRTWTEITKLMWPDLWKPNI